MKTTYGRRAISNTPRASHQIGSFSSAFAIVNGPPSSENLEPAIQNQQPLFVPLNDVVKVEGDSKSLGKRDSRTGEKTGAAEKGRKRRNCAIDSTRR